MAQTCDNKNIPEYLHQNDRESDQTFLGDEFIYRRFKCRVPYEEWTNGTDVSASLFPMDNDSYNRQKYCNSPEDVLLNTIPDGDALTDYGILQIPCKNVLTSSGYEDQSGNKFKMGLVHDPEPCMYPHTEIRLSQNGGEKKDKCRPANAQFRDELKTDLVLIKPEIIIAKT